jgi:hypothetical protein
MSALPPNIRYCPSCGQPNDLSAGNCPRCGNPLPAMTGAGYSAAPAASSGPAATAPMYGSGAPPPSGGFPGWAIGLIACVVAAPILVAVTGVVAAIAIPNFIKFSAREKSDSAKSNLASIWVAEKAWAASHGGTYVEFSIDEQDQTDPEFQKLSVKLDKIHHAYDAYVDGGTLWITASGNIDEDEFLDEWELSSNDPTPFHFGDDVTDVSQDSRQTSGDDEDADMEEEGTSDPGGVAGGIVGGVAGGLGVSGTGATDPDKMEQVQLHSESAEKNLAAIWAREKDYKVKHKSYMAFTDGNAATWSALGVTLPADTFHTYKAKVTGNTLLLTAVGNLDDDDFLDEWQLDSNVGTPVQLKNDALNLDLSAMAGILGLQGKKK